MRRQQRDQLQNPLKHQARVKLGIAVSAGKIKRPVKCSRCDQPHKRIEGHHPDYTKPLDVVWLCPPCHSVIHPHARHPLYPRHVACTQCGQPIVRKRKQTLCFTCRHRVRLACHTCSRRFILTKSAYRQAAQRRSKQYQDQWFCSKSCFGQAVGQDYGWQHYHAAKATKG